MIGRFGFLISTAETRFAKLVNAANVDIRSPSCGLNYPVIAGATAKLSELQEVHIPPGPPPPLGLRRTLQVLLSKSYKHSITEKEDIARLRTPFETGSPLKMLTTKHFGGQRRYLRRYQRRDFQGVQI